MNLRVTVMQLMLPSIILAASPFNPVIRNVASASVKRNKRCYADNCCSGGYYDSYGYYDWCQQNYSPCYPYPGYYNSCSGYYQYPTADPSATLQPTQALPPYTKPTTTRPTYIPVAQTRAPTTPIPTYIPVTQTNAPTTPVPTYIVRQTHVPITARPPYIPVGQTRAPIITRPPYIPVGQTRAPIITRPPYIPVWQTRAPIVTRPHYVPAGQTRTPIIMRPTYEPVWQTKDPVISLTNDTHELTEAPITNLNNLNSTDEQVDASNTTRPATTTLPPEYPVSVGFPEELSVPILASITPRPSRPSFIPLAKTKPPKKLRQRYESNILNDSPESPVNKMRGCKKICVDERQWIYCCENEKRECPIIDKSSCNQHGSSSNSINSCIFDNHCQDGYKCCYNDCSQDYQCTFVNHEHHNPSMSLEDYLKSVRHQRETLHHRVTEVELTVLFPVDSEDSMTLFEGYLKPIIKDFENNVVLNLLPVETEVAAEEDQVAMGLGRIIHCAANHFPDQQSLLSLTTCIMNSEFMLSQGKPSRAQSAARKCGRSIGYRWRPVSKCIMQGNGHHLLATARMRYQDVLDSLNQDQLSALSNGVPLLVLNKTVFDTRTMSTKAWLIEKICEELRPLHESHPICKELSPSGGTQQI